MNTVLMLYPHQQIINRDNLTPSLRCCGYESLKRYWTKALIGIVTPKVFESRWKLINKRIQQYRNADFNVGWIVFSKEDNLIKPDASSISHLFEIHDNDAVISAGFSYQQYVNPEIRTYCKASNVVSQVNGIEKVVVGGFHHDDCVPRMVYDLNNLRIEAVSDDNLTELFFAGSMELCGQDLFQYMIDNGTLDALMHEDNPVEEKQRLENLMVYEGLKI